MIMPPDDPLETPSTSRCFCLLARNHHLSPSALEYVLRRLGTIPDRHAWRRFIDNVLLFLGISLTLAGIIFFFAYNWADMTYFAKFGVLQAGILSLALFASLRGLERLSGQSALLAAAVLVGALLAVYGQVYQTGADAFSLFLIWAILITPWVILGAFSPLWLLLLLLFNLSLILYWEQIINPPGSDPRIDLFLLLFLLNGTALIAWELAYQQGITWLQSHWVGILLFIVTLTFLIIPTLITIIDFAHWQIHPLFAIAVGLYVAMTVFSLWYYHSQRQDLLLLAITLFGVLIVVTTLVGKVLPLGREEISWLILALVVIGQASLATKWLLLINQKWQEA
jgi:uncharacterized membrane protein